jgi:anti-sigma factor RsiW
LTDAHDCEPMNCETYYAALRDYMEQVLAAPRRAAVEQHVAACTACAAFHALAHEISCREIAEFLDDYSDGMLPAEKRAVFERHLEFCGECETYLASYRRTIAIGKSAYEKPADRGEQASTAPPEELIRAILAARKAR